MLVGSIHFLDVTKVRLCAKYVSTTNMFLTIFQIFLRIAWPGAQHVPTPSGSLLHPVKRLQRPHEAVF